MIVVGDDGTETEIDELESLMINRVPVKCPDGTVHIRVTVFALTLSGKRLVFGMYPSEASAVGRNLYHEAREAIGNNRVLEQKFEDDDGHEHFVDGHVHDRTPDLNHEVPK